MTYANLTNLFPVFNIKNSLEYKKYRIIAGDYAVFR